MKEFGKYNLRDEINEVEEALESSYRTMQLVNDDELIDFYAYLIKAYEAKYGYLLKKIKEN